MNKGEVPHFLDVSPNNIWLYCQNDPKLVIRDLKEIYPDIDETVVERSLMARGINKWLKVRRDLIAHKKALKNEIKELMVIIETQKAALKDVYVHTSQVAEGIKTIYDFVKYTKALNEYLKNKERLKFLQRERGILKKLCMTERWQDWRGKSLEEMNTLTASDL